MTKANQKIVLVTGATSGIGKAIALTLGQYDMTIIAVGRNKRKLQSLRRDIWNQGGVCHTYSVDLGKQASVKTLSQNIKKRFSKIYWIIYSAGTMGTDVSMDHKKQKNDKNNVEVNYF